MERTHLQDFSTLKYVCVCADECVTAIRTGQYTTARCACWTSAAGQPGLLLRLLHFFFTPSACELLCVCVCVCILGVGRDRRYSLHSTYVPCMSCSSVISVILNAVLTTTDKQRYSCSYLFLHPLCNCAGIFENTCKYCAVLLPSKICLPGMTPRVTCPSCSLCC